jgi:hypothetical protein
MKLKHEDDLTYFFGELYVVYMDRVSTFPFVCECDVDRLGSVSFYSPFLNHFWVAVLLVCSFCEAMAGSLSVDSTAVSSAKVAVVDSGEVGRSAVYSRYNTDPGTLTWHTPALTAGSSVYLVSTHLAMKNNS